MLNKRTTITIFCLSLSFAVAAMVAIFVFFPAKHVRPACPAPILKKAPQNMNWPVFRGNQNLSAVSDAALADEFALAWTFTDGGGIESTPTINDGMVFVTASDGKVYALASGDGSKIWEFNSGDPFEASALYFKNTVYAGNQKGVFYALDAKTGIEKWEYATDDKIAGSANYAEIAGDQSLVLVGGYDNIMRALDADTGKLIWNYATKNYINGSPAVNKDRLAFGGCDGVLRILQIADGVETASFQMGSYIANSACFYENNIYLANYSGKLFCVSPEQNKILWQFPKDSSLGPFTGSPAVNMDRVVIGCQDNQIYSVNRLTGELDWSFTTKGDVKSSPVISSGKVVAGSSDGRLYILNLADGTKLWSYEIGEAISGFAVTGEMIIVGAGTGVYAFRADSSRPQNSKSGFRNAKQ